MKGAIHTRRQVLVVVAAASFVLLGSVTAAQELGQQLPQHAGRSLSSASGSPVKQMARDEPKLTFGPGIEPHRMAGERGQGTPRLCQKGTYKAYAGAYPCKKCAEGFMAPNEGTTRCIRCVPTSLKTSSDDRTKCVSKAGMPKTFAAQVQQRLTTPRYGPGQEPYGSKNNLKSRPCNPGFAKPYTGKYSCQKCKSGFIASSKGTRRCTRCTPTYQKTSNSGNTQCVNKPNYHPSKSNPAPKPNQDRPLSSSDQKRKSFATVQKSAAPCQGEDNGSQRCGIPVGYADNDRTGSVFFPQGYKGKSIPYMLLWHGAGWTGSDMINKFKFDAIRAGFAIVAPDSHNKMFWSSPDKPTDSYTVDWYHVEACWNSVMKMPGVIADANSLSTFGNSHAAYASTPYASRATTNFKSAVIIHASALAAQMGSREFPILWVTGTKDPLYGPGPASIDVKNFRAARPGYKITWQQWIDYHGLDNGTEVTGMVDWWLKPDTRSRRINTYG